MCVQLWRNIVYCGLTPNSHRCYSVKKYKIYSMNMIKFIFAELFFQKIPCITFKGKDSPTTEVKWSFSCSFKDLFLSRFSLIGKHIVSAIIAKQKIPSRTGSLRIILVPESYSVCSSVIAYCHQTTIHSWSNGLFLPSRKSNGFSRP